MYFPGIKRPKCPFNPLGCLGMISNPYPCKQHPAYLWFADVNKISALSLHHNFNRQCHSQKNQGLTNINQRDARD